MSAREPAAEAADHLARARALAPLLAAASPEIERERRLTPPVVDALHEAGLFRMLLPRAYGGGETDPMSFAQMLEEIARHDASTAWCLGQTGVCAMAAAYLPPESARAIWGDRRGVLAWGAAAPPVKALAAEGGWRVTGSWSFASGGHHATWLGGHCIECEADGTPRKRAGRPVARTLLFPAAAVAWTDIWDVIGLNGTGSDKYSVSDLFVPHAFTFDRDEPAERRMTGPLYLFRTDQMYASGFCCVALGLARGMLDALAALATEKTPRGYKTTMRMSAVVQTEIAELEARLRAARFYILGTLEAAWRAAERGDMPMEHRMAIRLAATHCIREARRIAGDAYNAAGTTSVFADNPFERRLRDINSVAQQLQGRRSHFETVGKYLLGLEAEPLFL
ncbi:MAG TPA: acyl-CoA dehydrogenase family protein [Stellaceae bacterium]|nr:acyl-CoA dehydrogenase family protein [Stellaceae bacterium]